MTKELILRRLEETKATFFKITGNGSSIVVTDKPTEEVPDEFSALYDGLLPGKYQIEMRVSKNDSKGGQSISFKVGEGTSHTVSGLEAIGGPTPWILMQENQALKEKIQKLEFDAQLKELERKQTDQFNKLKEKEGSGGLEKLSGVIGQIAQIINAVQPGAAPGARMPVSTQAPISGLPPNQAEPDPSDKVAADMEAIAAALGSDDFISTVAKLAEKARINPKEFADKMKTAIAFI